MNNQINQNYNGFDFILKSIYTDISIPAAPLLSKRNPAGFSFYLLSFNLISVYTKRCYLS